MAEIPVHKKSSLAWLWILVGLVALALLLWWLFARNDRAVEPVATEPVATTQTTDDPVGAAENAMEADAIGDAGSTAQTATTGTITQFGEVLDTANLDSLVGRKVAFANAPVESVTDDMGFWIGESKARRTYVALHEVPSPNNSKTEGNVDVNRPSRVMIEGEVVKNTGTPAPGIEVTLPKVSSYIRASKVAVVNGR